MKRGQTDKAIFLKIPQILHEIVNIGNKKYIYIAKMVKVHDFLVHVYTSQDFAQTQQNFAPSHDGETVTFQNSAEDLPTLACCSADLRVYSCQLSC